MKTRNLLLSALIGAVASARAMTPMATIAAARLMGRRTPGRLVLLDRPVFKLGALTMGVGELVGVLSRNPGFFCSPVSAGRVTQTTG